MANTLKRIQGRATIAGTALYTVGVGETLTIVGIRAANNDSVNNHTFHIDVNGYLITGIDTPLPVGSALEAAEGTKVVVQEGDVITAFGDTDNNVDLTISFLEQTP